MIRLLLDVDGVIADFRVAYITCCNKANGTNFTVEDIEDSFSYAKKLNLSRDQVSKTWKQLGEPGIVLSMPEMPGAVEAVRKLIRQNFVECYFVTSAPCLPNWHYERLQWLEKRFLGVLETNNITDFVVFTGDKRVVKGDVFVDDKDLAVSGWQMQFPEGTGIVWGQAAEDSYYSTVLKPAQFFPGRDWQKLSKLVYELNILKKTK